MLTHDQFAVANLVINYKEGAVLVFLQEYLKAKRLAASGVTSRPYQGLSLHVNPTGSSVAHYRLAFQVLARSAHFCFPFA